MSEGYSASSVAMYRSLQAARACFHRWLFRVSSERRVIERDIERWIGPGLFIQHGFSTIIAAKSLGENCWVNQQVAIGFSNVDDCPTLGNNVSIKVGAIVIGDITIGDNAVVGAGAVVVEDVPPGCTVASVPARVIRRP